jgi:HAD superfamily hydrolase (TIGR01549 family)
MIFIIFDLDQTLLDTSAAEVYRNSKRWALAYSEIPNFKPYDGFESVFKYIEENSISSCIVTNSPSTYCYKVTKYWDINCKFHICFHDTKKRKPDPEPYLLAIKTFNTSLNKVLAIGDRDIDIIAAHAAGIKSVACLWGTHDKTSLIQANPTFTAISPLDLLVIIKELNA